MHVTVIVRSATGSESRLTFDGTQRIVMGRGAGCDVRLPDASVSLRHAILHAQGADFVLVDEGSTNGTFVGDVRIAARTSRLVRSGEFARLGRVWIQIRFDHDPITRDLAAATRDLALALVAGALDAVGGDPTTRVVVVEGRDQGSELPLREEGRAYVAGRGADCDLPLADVDASRQHAHVTRRAGFVYVCDRSAKNGTWLGAARIPADQEVLWRQTQMLRIGQTVLALREPLAEALAWIESLPDEPMKVGQAATPPPSSAAQAAPQSGGGAAPIEVPLQKVERKQARARWNGIDAAVITVAALVLLLSIAGLVWLLKG